MLFANPGGRFDAIHLALQIDVHQNQVRGFGRGELDRLLTRGGDACHRITQPVQPLLEFEGYRVLILDDQNPCLGHDVTSAGD